MYSTPTIWLKTEIKNVFNKCHFTQEPNFWPVTSKYHFHDLCIYVSVAWSLKARRSTNLLEVFQSQPLHLHHLVVARSVVERVTSLREIVQHVSRVENGHQAAVHPGYAKKVVWKVKVDTLQILPLKSEVCRAKIQHSNRIWWSS